MCGGDDNDGGGGFVCCQFLVCLLLLLLLSSIQLSSCACNSCTIIILHAQFVRTHSHRFRNWQFFSLLLCQCNTNVNNCIEFKSNEAKPFLRSVPFLYFLCCTFRFPFWFFVRATQFLLFTATKSPMFRSFCFICFHFIFNAHTISLFQCLVMCDSFFFFFISFYCCHSPFWYFYKSQCEQCMHACRLPARQIFTIYIHIV